VELWGRGVSLHREAPPRDSLRDVRDSEVRGLDSPGSHCSGPSCATHMSKCSGAGAGLVGVSLVNNTLTQSGWMQSHPSGHHATHHVHSPGGGGPMPPTLVASASSASGPLQLQPAPLALPAARESPSSSSLHDQLESI